MNLAPWRRPIVAALSGLRGRGPPRLGLSPPLPRPVPAPPAGGIDVGGRRSASVKTQGAYKLKPKRTIPRKLGAKKTTGQYVIPGNIIWKQRGTTWWPGENCKMGRDHTIHATAPGFVQFYRDPGLHPDRKFIGVTFKLADKLPYPRHEPRRRRLGLVAVPILDRPAEPALSPSGIPRRIEQVAGLRRNPRKQRPGPRILRLRDDYSYREDNWRIGLLGKRERKVVFRGRRAGFRAARLKRVREIEAAQKGRDRKAVRTLKKLQEKFGGEPRPGAGGGGGQAGEGGEGQAGREGGGQSTKSEGGGGGVIEMTVGEKDITTVEK